MLTLIVNILYNLMYFLEDVLSWRHYTPMSSMLKSYQWFEMMGSSVFMFRWIFLPLYLTPGSPI